MYRHNQLKEELDKLRKENNSLKKQSEYLLWKLAQKDLQIGNLQFQLRVKDMSFQLSSLQKLIDDKKALEPFKAGVDISTSKAGDLSDGSYTHNELHSLICQISAALAEKIQESNERKEIIEIIDKKGVDVGFLKACKTLEIYNSTCWNDEVDFNKKLIQEEFDTLKRHFK